ncbi:MAG: bifunctional aldolase/short-chain dehydrogenase [Actinomycetota bacterium]
MFSTAPVNLWSSEQSAGLSPVEALAYRSNLLASDRAIVNFGGGNTSAKVREVDHTGADHEVLWVKGSGSDLATIQAAGFTGLRLAEILPLMERGEMTDEQMVAYLGRCQLDPKMPRSSIETLLHAFVPHPHVDHTHPDSIGAIVGAVDGERLAAECFEGDAIWIPYLRPGFALSKLVGEAIRERPEAKLILLAKHGLVTWGDTAEAAYEATLDAVARAATFVEARRGSGTAEGRRPAIEPEERDELLAAVLPLLRGAVSVDGPRILQVDTSPAVLDFVSLAGAADLSQVGAACPDHLVHTKRRPLWIEFDNETETAAELGLRIVEGVRAFQERERAYFEEHRAAPDKFAGSSPRVILIQGVGLVAVGATVKAAMLSRDLYHRAIAVMNGAATLGGFVSLTDAESYAVEYWPLELYKLALAPAPKEFQGRVALITGAAGGIGGAIARALSDLGACIVATDINPAVHELGDALGDSAIALRTDVTDEQSVAESFALATLAFGGVDIVVSNAGIATSAPIEETTLDLWEKNFAVLTRGYFLIAREAVPILRAQGLGGSIVFIGSKNALAAGKGASAYSSAKAAELHLARCLAEELGADGVRVNVVNPDAVLEGSKIWDSSWREERARGYGIEPAGLEDFYRARTTLKVNVVPADVAEGVLFFASPARSGKSTGNVLNVDGGVAAAYPR